MARTTRHRRHASARSRSDTAALIPSSGRVVRRSAREEGCRRVRNPHPEAAPSQRDAATKDDRERGVPVANIKSKIKRIRTNEQNRLRNKSVKSALKTAIRKFREAADAGDKDKAIELQRAAGRALDKAASKGVIHPNQAANKKSAMAKRVNKL